MTSEFKSLSQLQFWYLRWSLSTTIPAPSKVLHLSLSKENSLSESLGFRRLLLQVLSPCRSKLDFFELHPPFLDPTLFLSIFCLIIDFSACIYFFWNCLFVACKYIVSYFLSAWRRCGGFSSTFCLNCLFVIIIAILWFFVTKRSRFAM